MINAILIPTAIILCTLAGVALGFFIGRSIPQKQDPHQTNTATVLTKRERKNLPKPEVIHMTPEREHEMGERLKAEYDY